MNVAVFRINKSPSSCEIYLSSPEQTNKQTNKQTGKRWSNRYIINNL